MLLNPVTGPVNLQCVPTLCRTFNASREPAVLAADEPAEKSAPSKADVEESDLKESKLKDKEKLDQAVKLRETEEAAENAGTTTCVWRVAIWLK